MGQRWHHHVAIVVSSAYILPTSSLLSERLAVKICDVNPVNHHNFGRVCDAMIHRDSLLMTGEKYAFAELVELRTAQRNPWRFFTWIRDDQRDADNASGDSTNWRELIVIVRSANSPDFARSPTTSVSQQQQRESSFINKPANETCCLINEVLVRETLRSAEPYFGCCLRRAMHLQPAPLRFC